MLVRPAESRLQRDSTASPQIELVECELRLRTATHFFADATQSLEGRDASERLNC